MKNMQNHGDLTLVEFDEAMRKLLAEFARRSAKKYGIDEKASANAWLLRLKLFHETLSV